LEIFEFIYGGQCGFDKDRKCGKFLKRMHELHLRVIGGK